MIATEHAVIPTRTPSLLQSHPGLDLRGTHHLLAESPSWIEGCVPGKRPAVALAAHHSTIRRAGEQSVPWQGENWVGQVADCWPEATLAHHNRPKRCKTVRVLGPALGTSAAR
jgi:hypothetical protein